VAGLDVTDSVLVLGGYGAVGMHVSRLLAEAGRSVLVGGRDLPRAERLAKSLPMADAAQTDVAVPDSLAAVLARAAMVVNCTGSEDPLLARTVLNSGVDFVDISAATAYLDALSSLHDEATALNARLLVGVGLAPGLSTLLAAGLHRDASAPGSIDITCLLGVGEEAGAASRQWTFGRTGTLFPDPSRSGRTVRNFTQPEVITLPAGFGRRRAYRFDFPDQHDLTRKLGVEVVSRLCFDSRVATTMFATLAYLPSLCDGVEMLSRKLPMQWLGGEWWLVHALHRDGSERWATGANQAYATAAVTSLALEPLTRAAPGVHHLHDLVSDRHLAAELDRLEILLWLPPP